MVGTKNQTIRNGAENGAAVLIDKMRKIVHTLFGVNKEEGI